jgi:hypothetical protein
MAPIMWNYKRYKRIKTFRRSWLLENTWDKKEIDSAAAHREMCGIYIDCDSEQGTTTKPIFMFL